MSVKKKTLGLFPGQGSQKVGMGKELYEKHELARELFAAADKALGASLSQICFEGPEARLTSTEIAQPAILTVSTICYRLSLQDGSADHEISAAAGHSLGEYSALVAAEAISFEDAVLLVHKRGRYMQEAVPAGAGKMVAVLGKEVPELEAAIAKVKGGIAQIANNNAPGQIVIAGDRAGVDEFLQHLGAAKSIELAVSAPFHCALMKPAEETLAKDLQVLSVKPGRFLVYSNYTGKVTRTAEEIRDALRLQVCGQVRWVECMQNALADHAPEQCVEFGTGNVLTGLMKRIDSKLPRVNYQGPQ